VTRGKRANGQQKRSQKKKRGCRALENQRCTSDWMGHWSLGYKERKERTVVRLIVWGLTVGNDVFGHGVGSERMGEEIMRHLGALRKKVEEKTDRTERVKSKTESWKGQGGSQNGGDKTEQRKGKSVAAG